MKRNNSIVPLKLMIADNHDEFRQCLEYYFRSRRGLRIIEEARNGAEAIAKAIMTHPDLVFINSTLPRLGGWITAKAIKARCPEAHCVVITIDTEPKNVKIPSAVEAHLEKGRITRELPAVIAKVRSEVKRSRLSPPRSH